MNRFFPFGALLALVLPLAACDKVKDATNTGEPQTSYCEALCDWAAGCHADDRGLDEAGASALEEACLTDARAADPGCADAESGEIDPATSRGLTTCTDAIEENASNGECGAFTGNQADIETATTPSDCATQGTDAQEVFDVVQDSTEESGDELCDRFTDTFCEQTSTCLAEVLGDAYQDAVDAVGLEPKEKCLDTTAVSNENSECKSTDQYEPGESATDVNASREAARSCLQDLAALDCDELISGNIPATCGAAVGDIDEYGQAILDLIQEYQDAGSR